MGYVNIILHLIFLKNGGYEIEDDFWSLFLFYES